LKTSKYGHFPLQLIPSTTPNKIKEKNKAKIFSSLKVVFKNPPTSVAKLHPTF
jgi:hypothetical protein